LGVLVALALSAFVAGWPSESARAQPAETLEFVNVEINRTGMLFPERWVITENSASLDTPQYSHEHSWTIPRTIPPTGAQATVTTTATDKTGGRISAVTTLFGYIDIDGTTGVSVVANADAAAGQATVTETRTVTLAPRGGGPPFVTARVQDGPDVRFNYRIVPTPGQ